MRAIFDDSSYELAILDTGYRKSLASLRVGDGRTLVQLLKTNVLMRVKPELDQFISGLKCCGVLDALRAHPAVLSKCFLHCSVDLTTGWCVYILCTCVAHIALLVKSGLSSYAPHAVTGRSDATLFLQSILRSSLMCSMVQTGQGRKSSHIHFLYDS